MGENCNTGNWNTGYCNTGDCNTGYYNTGDCNTGNCNTGDCNTGYCNTGYYNTGDFNTGDYNTGDFNAGDCNTGDFNTGDHETGCFCTETHTIRIFDADSGMTFCEWRDSDYYRVLSKIDARPVIWVCKDDMTEQERTEHPECTTTGGYLRKVDPKDAYQRWWDGLSEDDRDIIRSIPNFDADKFKQITGVGVDVDD